MIHSVLHLQLCLLQPCPTECPDLDTQQQQSQPPKMCTLKANLEGVLHVGRIKLDLQLLCLEVDLIADLSPHRHSLGGRGDSQGLLLTWSIDTS